MQEQASSGGPGASLGNNTDWACFYRGKEETVEVMAAREK